MFIDWMDERFFVALAAIIFFVLAFSPVRRRLVSVIDRRILSVAQQVQEAKRLREEAQILLDTYRHESLMVQTEVERMMDHARQEALRLTRESEQTLEAVLEKRTSLAFQRIAAFEAAILQEIKQHAVDVAVAAVHTLLRERMAGELSDETLSIFLHDIEKRIN